MTQALTYPDALKLVNTALESGSIKLTGPTGAADDADAAKAGALDAAYLVALVKALQADPGP